MALILAISASGCTTSRTTGSRDKNEVLARIRSRGVLRIGTTGDYRPFTFRTPGGDYVGMDIELARELAARLNVTPVFVPTTWKSLSRDLSEKRFDLAMGGISKTAERERVGTFSRAYRTDGKAPIARCSEKSRYDSLAKIDRAGTTVIVNAGGTNEKFVSENLHRPKIRIVSDNNAVFAELVAGRADVMITDSAEVELAARMYPVLCATLTSETFDRFEKAYYLPKDEEWRDFVDAWLRPYLTGDTLVVRFLQAIEKFADKNPKARTGAPVP